MEDLMFCYQCEQTAAGTGCTSIGVCGKDDTVAMLQDLLIYQVEGMSVLIDDAQKKGQAVPDEVRRFMIEALFMTLTNVNFDPARFYSLIRKSNPLKAALLGEARLDRPVANAVLMVIPDDEAGIRQAAARVALRPPADRDVDIRSLKDTLLFGIKGMAAYAYHAWVLGYQDESVSRFIDKGLAAILDDGQGVNDLLGLLMELGQANLKCMELLDTANIRTFGDPRPTEVVVTVKKGPFIIVSGHDLYDLKQILEQTAGKGVSVYTHGEMLPAHGYPELKKYPHLVGNYGSAWQNQRKEFDGLPGCVVMTTNCIQEPKPSYADRIYSTGLVGWPDVAHVDERDGKKDFSAVIDKAIALGGWQDDEQEHRILVGFGHTATLSQAGAVVEAVKAGKIKHFFLVGGCDGAKIGRNYYTEFAERVPEDAVILTLACGKYRFNQKSFGDIDGIPRLLDVGQCNDAYSAIQIAVALAGAFNCGVNDLPLTLVLSWYEQKAVSILLTLLSLGIKNIYLGPSLPAFLSPNVLQLLVEKFEIHPTTTPVDDLKTILG